MEAAWKRAALDLATPTGVASPAIQQPGSGLRQQAVTRHPTGEEPSHDERHDDSA
jgi:hypothetical protein